MAKNDQNIYIYMTVDLVGHPAGVVSAPSGDSRSTSRFALGAPLRGASPRLRRLRHRLRRRHSRLRRPAIVCGAHFLRLDVMSAPLGDSLRTSRCALGAPLSGCAASPLRGGKCNCYCILLAVSRLRTACSCAAARCCKCLVASWLRGFTATRR